MFGIEPYANLTTDRRDRDRAGIEIDMFDRSCGLWPRGRDTRPHTWRRRGTARCSDRTHGELADGIGVSAVSGGDGVFEGERTHRTGSDARHFERGLDVVAFRGEVDMVEMQCAHQVDDVVTGIDVVVTGEVDARLREPWSTSSMRPCRVRRSLVLWNGPPRRAAATGSNSGHAIAAFGASDARVPNSTSSE